MSDSSQKALGDKTGGHISSEKRLLGYFTRYWKLFAAGLICTVAVSGIEVWLIMLIRDVIGEAIRGAMAAAEGTESGSARRLNQIAMTIIAVHVLKWAFAYGQIYMVSSATQKIAVKLRNDLYSHLQTLALSFFERTRVGHLMSRMTNDVGLIQQSAPTIIDVVKAPLVAVGATVVIFSWNWVLALIAVVLLPVIAYTITRIGRGIRNLSELLQIKLADVAAIVQETLSGVRIVKSFGMENYEINRFAEENQRTYRSAMRAVKRSAAMTPTVEFIGVAGMALVVVLGGNMVVRGTMPGFGTEELIAFLFALERIGNSAKNIARLNVTYHQTMAGAQRIFDILDEIPEVQEKLRAVKLTSVDGRVECRNISFSYSRRQRVLDNVSFVMEPGRQVALVGPSGAGKSTIANLIPRFYDVNEGSILIDGLDIRDVSLESLRRQIAIVPQETILFGSTIKENIAYGNIDASDEEIFEAAKAANADDFITSLPDGYQTLVGERGAKLSGGERQRVAIARALLKDPKLLILDEATSSLDVASEAVVQEALERLMKNRTTLVIAHRLSTIVKADKILVMQAGRIVESGTHRELLGIGGLYAELYSIQSKGSSSGEAEENE